jgi:thiamine transport system permease protein
MREFAADWGRRGIFLLPFLFLGVFYLYPLLAILRVSFATEGGGLTVLAALGDPRFWRVVWFTTWQAGVSTLLTLLASLPMAYVFATYAFPGKRLLHALLAVPFVMPSVVVAMGFLALFGRTGLVNQWLMQIFGLRAPPLDLEQSIWLILLANIFYNVSVIVRTVGGFWSDLNPHLREAAAVLGADGWRAFRRVTLPLLMPSVLAASSLVFLFCFTSFSLILILGGPNFATLEVEIYRQAVNYFNLPLAAFLSLVQMALTFAIMVIYTRYQARTSRGLRRRTAGSSARRPANARQWLVVISLIAVTVIGLAAPLLALVVRSFTLGGAFTLRYYAALAENPRQSAFFVPPIQAVANSLTIAVVALAISLPLGVIAAYVLARRRDRWTATLDPLLLLPLGTSAVTLGFGYIIALGPLRTSFWLTPIAHALIALPFVVRTFLPSLRAFDVRLREAAATLGAAPGVVWRRIDLPLLMRPLLVAAVFAFTISLGEFGATLLIVQPDRPTMPTVVYRLLGQPGLLNYGQALAMSTVLMAVTLVALVLIEQLGADERREF